MTRLVLIHDELKKKFHLVTGQGKIEVILSQTVARPNAGYAKVLDVNLPLRQEAILEVGVSANVTIDIDCDSNTDRWLDQIEKQALENILNNGAVLIKSYVENQASQIKTIIFKTGMSTVDLNRILVVTFPELFGIIQQVLDEAMRRFPFLLIKLHHTLNLSNHLGGFLEQEQQNRFEAWKGIVLHQLETPYDPQTEFGAVRDHYEKLIQTWPSTMSPSEEDLAKVHQLIQTESNKLERNMLIQLNQPGFTQKMLSLPKGSRRGN